MNTKWIALVCVLAAVGGIVIYQFQEKSAETNIDSGPGKQTLSIINKAKSFKDPSEALTYIQTAQESDQDNPYLFLQKAEILENQLQLGKARLEFQNAVQAAPQNPEIIDQLAEFYRRHGHYNLALRTWYSGLTFPNSGSLWSKFLFWNKTVEAFNEEPLPSTIPDDDLKPFVSYLLALQPHEFWDSLAFEQLPNISSLLNTRQETFWLKMMDSLLHGRNDEALQILQTNPFHKVSWNPELEKTLEKNIANSSEPFAEAFLTAGWDAAALDFSQFAEDSRHLPDWMVVKLLKAIRKQHGNEAALHFALQQHPTPSLQLLIAQMQIAEGDKDEGISRLIRLSREDSEEAFRAAWILTKIYLDQNNYESAKRTIYSQNRLSQHVMGREVLAEIALREGSVDQAENIYVDIQGDSSAAKMYFARQAIREQNWDKANELLKQILRDDPNHAEANSELGKIQ